MQAAVARLALPSRRWRRTLSSRASSAKIESLHERSTAPRTSSCSARLVGKRHRSVATAEASDLLRDVGRPIDRSAPGPRVSCHGGALLASRGSSRSAPAGPGRRRPPAQRRAGVDGSTSNTAWNGDRAGDKIMARRSTGCCTICPHRQHPSGQQLPREHAPAATGGTAES